jgi:hypothetical protein
MTGLSGVQGRIMNENETEKNEQELTLLFREGE